MDVTDHWSSIKACSIKTCRVLVAERDRSGRTRALAYGSMRTPPKALKFKRRAVGARRIAVFTSDTIRAATFQVLSPGCGVAYMPLEMESCDCTLLWSLLD